jgi:hypothetical protein
MFEPATLLGTLLRFNIGVLGAAAYFVAVKTGFLRHGTDDPKFNPHIFRPSVLMFFSLLGGMLPLLFGVMTYYGCFVYGLAVRPMINTIYMGARYGKG